MIRITKKSPFDGSRIPVDPFWNVGDEQERKMHRIHAYPAKFPAFLTTKALHYAKAQKHSPGIIADIFCGCGTVAYEAKRYGIDFWGCDINPVATLIAKAKSNSYNSARLQYYFDQTEARYVQTTFEGVPYKEADERIKYWFDQWSYRSLWRLLQSIDATIDAKSKYHTFFRVAFSNILKPSSRWLTKSIKPQIDPTKERIDVFETFSRQCRFAIKANDEFDEDDIAAPTKVTIKTADFLSPRLNRPTVDLIITSPPYVTSYEYADLHQLSALWLHSKGDYRDFRIGSIGSLYHDSNFENNIESLNTVGVEIVERLKAVDSGKARSVAKYFVDMQNVTSRAFSMLSQNGLSLFVIGNTKYSGVRIDNSRHLIQAMFDAGFTDIRVTKRKISKKILTPYRSKEGRFTSDGRGRKVYGEEYIVVGRP